MAEFDPRQAALRIDLATELEFELGGLTVRPADLAVERNGERRELQPQVMKVLVALARNRPTVMSRDRLIELCWQGRVVGDDSLYRCILALRHVAQEFEPPPFAIETVSRVGHRLLELEPQSGRKMLPGLNWQAMAGIGVVATALIAVTYYLGQAGPWPWAADKPALTVLVAAGGGDTHSRTLAQELAIDLGSQGVNSSAMRLVGAARDAPVKPDLVVEVTRVADPTIFGATVALRASRDRSILWSNEFQEPSRSRGDLKHQLTMTTARILSCALEGMSSEDHLSDQTLKKYLNACAALSDSQYDVGKTVPLLEEVVRASPQFVGGWAKLLLAETALISSDEPGGEARRRSLARHVASAQRIQPGLPEAYIADYVLTAPNNFLTRYRLIDAAVVRNPNHAQARVERAMFLHSVGQTTQGLRDSAQAVRLDPFSPAVRDNYITMLAIAGRMDIASEELSRADRLWPGATSLTWSRYRLHLRFGDPRVALQLLRSGAVDPPGAKVHEPFLQARITPTVENVERAIQKGRSAAGSPAGSVDGHIQALAQFDRKEELIQFLLNWKRMDKVDQITSVIFRPAFSELHRDPRFMRVADHLGLLEFWRKAGAWPDICSSPDLPYDCKHEAAKATG